MRFLSDILNSLDSKFDGSIELGCGFKVLDILNNLEPVLDLTGFSGVCIDISTGRLNFRAFASKTINSPLRSKAFSVKKYGYSEAWMMAIKERAMYVGFKGPIPDVSPPDKEGLLSHCRLKKNQKWIDDNNIVSLLEISTTVS